MLPNALHQLNQSPPFWDEACAHLIRTDRVMRKLIPLYGVQRMQRQADPFTTLARSVVGQQISLKAAQASWERFARLPKRMSPSCVLKVKVDDMRAAGLSARKVEYIVDLALQFDGGGLHVKQWPTMDDDAVIKELIGIRGIGRWTADMFLMFHLQRPNVLPLDDASLLAGVSQQYFSGEPLSRSDLRDLARAWSPYATVATWYIWRSLEPAASH